MIIWKKNDGLAGSESSQVSPIYKYSYVYAKNAEVYNLNLNFWEF